MQTEDAAARVAAGEARQGEIWIHEMIRADHEGTVVSMSFDHKKA